jgi:hypothetical protein
MILLPLPHKCYIYRNALSCLAFHPFKLRSPASRKGHPNLITWPSWARRLRRKSCLIHQSPEKWRDKRMRDLWACLQEAWPPGLQSRAEENAE